MKRALVLACALAGCGPSMKGADAPVRPPDEDPIALLPSGADLIADLDVEQLRRWPATHRFLALLPPLAQDRIHKLGFDPLADVDNLYATVSGLGTANVQSVLVLRGELDLDKLRNALGPPSEVATADYRDVPVLEGPDGALARVTPRIVVMASRADVRRVIDLARGEGESVRVAAGDRLVARAFARAPTAKSGRPALMLGLVPPPPLRDQLKKEGLPGHEIEWLCLSLAVGDGFDVGGLAALQGPAEAESLASSARAQLADFGSRMAVRALGLKPFIDPVVLKTRENEVHYAYRLPRMMVEQMLSRLEEVQKMAQRRELDK
jgi:hypothetical protein